MSKSNVQRVRSHSQGGTLQNNRNNVTLSLTPKDSVENNRNINRNGYGHNRNTGPGP
jgi:hypothetical protein